MASSFIEILAVTPVPCNTEGNDKRWWFGDSEDEDEPFNSEEAEQAAALCHTCPLRLPCLTRAITFHEPSGVWGGMTPAQRQALKGRI